MFPQPLRTVEHRRASRHRASYQLEYPGKGHHICGQYLPFLINPPRLGEAEYMLTRHVLFGLRLRNHHSALGETYPQPLTHPKYGSFPRCPSSVCVLPPLLPDEPWGSDHGIGIFQFFSKTNPTKHCERYRHCILDPHVVSPRYPSVVDK